MIYASKVIGTQHYHCNITDSNHGNRTQPNKNFTKVFKKHQVNDHPLILILSVDLPYYVHFVLLYVMLYAIFHRFATPLRYIFY